MSGMRNMHIELITNDPVIEVDEQINQLLLQMVLKYHTMN